MSIKQSLRNKIEATLNVNLKMVIEILISNVNIFSLLSLFQLYRENKLSEFEDIFKRLLQNRGDKDISLLKGDAMYIYISCLLFEQTKDKIYLDKAINIVRNSEVDNVYCENSLFKGYSGFLLSCLNLLSYTKNHDVLEKIDNLVNRLLSNVEYDQFGISWPNQIVNPYTTIKTQDIQNLCGFGNGACGITYMFSAMSVAFNNKAFLTIVVQALLRQRGLYNKENNNWPDFNLKIKLHSDQCIHIEELKKGNVGWFKHSYSNISLNEGLIGIALSNILMFRNTKYTEQKKVFYNALKKIEPLVNSGKINTEQVAEFGLLLLTGYNVLNDKKLLNSLERLFENFDFHIKEAFNNKISIYFYYLISLIYKIPNFIPQSNNFISCSFEDLPIAFISDDIINKKLLRSVFNRTIGFMELRNMSGLDMLKTKGHIVNYFVQNRGKILNTVDEVKLFNFSYCKSPLAKQRDRFLISF